MSTYLHRIACSLLMLAPFLLRAQIQTVSITNTTVNGGQDAFVRSTSGSVNNSTSFTVRVYTATTDFSRGLVQFNIAGMGIPAGAVIVSAELKLTTTGLNDDGGSIYVRRITSSWSESTVTYATIPNAAIVGQLTSTSADVSGPTRTIDVTAFVQSIYSGATTNYGWMLVRNPESAATTGNVYRSNTNSSNPPLLTVKYYEPFKIASANVVHATTTSSSDGAITPVIEKGSGNPNNTYTWTNSSGTVLYTGSTAAISGLSYGWYGLKVDGAYDSFYMAFLVGVKCETVNITFAPGPEFVDDAIIYGNLITPAGSNVLSKAERYQSGSWYSTTTLMRFRLWMDPALLALKSQLYLNGSNHINSGNNPAQLIKVTGNWVESTVTSTTQPTTNTSITASLPATTTLNQQQIIEIKDFWNDWKTDNTLNYGMRLQPAMPQNFANAQVFHSSDATTPSNRPKIEFRVDDASCDRIGYTPFKKELDAGYTTTFNKHLKFCFTEEYKMDGTKKIPLTLYDENNEIVAAIDINGNAISGKPLLGAFNYIFDDNRQSLNLTSFSLTPGKFYILQLTRSTGEKEYIKFQYTN